MKAAWFEKFGAAREVLVIGEKPTAGGWARRSAGAPAPSGVNPSDVKKRAGSNPALLDDGYVIPNSDGAGVIEAVGEGVDARRVGEKVWVYQAQFGRRFGTAAAVRGARCVARAVTLPIEAGFDVGACAGIPIMTAHRCVHADGAIAGQTVLVTGGAGRVGYYAIQWARMAGARVIASASNAARRSRLPRGGCAAGREPPRAGLGRAREVAQWRQAGRPRDRRRVRREPARDPGLHPHRRRDRDLLVDPGEGADAAVPPHDVPGPHAPLRDRVLDARACQEARDRRHHAGVPPRHAAASHRGPRAARPGLRAPTSWSSRAARTAASSST